MAHSTRLADQLKYVLFLQVDQREAALASLSLLVIIHCTWFVLENFLLDYYVR